MAEEVLNQIAVQTYSTDYGQLLLGAIDGTLCLCDWVDRARRSAVDDRLRRILKAEYIYRDCSFLKQVNGQLEDYFNGRRSVFSIPLRFAGTEFQKRVWSELLRIKYGTTISYRDLAERIGHPQAVRAVASANGANGLSIIVPCHRVINANGALGGYAGGVDAKEQLLLLEQTNSNCLT